MAGKKKFGAFEGVFTPSLLTILGVIMYMRLGWVVGNAGLIGTIAIILIAHIISITTGLSVSSVATDKKIGAGGIYYVLSRSMGIPIGGAIGIALYVGTAFSIALYLVGFAESFNGYFGLGTTPDDLRLSGTAALMLLTGIALISTSFALKTQFFILAAILFSLVAIFFGNSDYTPESVTLFASEGGVPLEIVFAIFFPAVTGFTAGIAMSGDLKDPKKSIPTGTLASIAVGLVVYIGLAIFISMTVDGETLRTDNNILMKIALFAPAVVAGIWGATLSSALGGILGGPRILQAMSLDKVTPRFFGKGKGKDNEPINALALVFVIAEAGILIGELDVIARIVSMFYLAAYGFINISFFLESWANPDFQPSFRIKRWIGLIGFIACFGVMFKLDMMAMFGAFAVIGGLYFWLQRKQVQLQSNDVWQSVWSNVVNKGLKKLEAKNSEGANWNPNILLFSGDNPDHRNHLLAFTKTISGRTGIVTDFKLLSGNGQKIGSKSQQSVQDDELEKFGIYGRQIQVADPYEGIETIASTYGFTGVEPNTVMMNWAKTTHDPVKYAEMTQKLIRLDYNLLYLDYDPRTSFGDYQTIDIWWRQTDSKNAEMMLNVARFITQSPQWTKPRIRILFVNHNNADAVLIKPKIEKLLSQLRVNAEIKIINNGVEQKSYYDIIKLQSSGTDLTILGIPNVEIDEQAEYILNTDQLFDTIGTTLLVKAANNFNALDLSFVQSEVVTPEVVQDLPPRQEMAHPELDIVLKDWDEHLAKSTAELAGQSLRAIASNYYEWLFSARQRLDKLLVELPSGVRLETIIDEVQEYLLGMALRSEKFSREKLPEIEEVFRAGMENYWRDRDQFLEDAPAKLKVTDETGKHTIRWNRWLRDHHGVYIVPLLERTLNRFGVQNFVLLNRLADTMREATVQFVESARNHPEEQEALLGQYRTDMQASFDRLLESAGQLEPLFREEMALAERQATNELAGRLLAKGIGNELRDERKQMGKKARRRLRANLRNFPAHWQENFQRVHDQLEADLKLIHSGLSVFGINERIKYRVRRLVTQPRIKEAELFSGALNYIQSQFGQLELGSYKSKTIESLSEAVPKIDLLSVAETEENKVLSLSNGFPSSVRLISAHSFNEFEAVQNEDVETIEVNLARIQDFIVQSNYLSSLQDTLQGLESNLRDHSEELYHAANLIRHLLLEEITEDNKERLQADVAKVAANTQRILESLRSDEKAFFYDLDTQLHNLQLELNIRQIVESIDTYAKVSTNPGFGSRIRQGISGLRDRITKKYDSIYAFLAQRKRQVDSIRFREEHAEYRNKIELTHDLVDAVSVQESVKTDLSFYYKKLFTGSHLGSADARFKQAEFAAARQAMDRMEEGVDGGLMVIGAAQSGKSYFLESLANGAAADRVYLHPPTEQNFDAPDLDRSFRNAFNRPGTAETILRSLPERTLLIFEDIECWWMKAPGGGGAVDALAQLMAKFGHQHQFLLSCNLYSYYVLKQLTQLESELLATVVLPPARREELKEIILRRHRTAKGELWYKDRLLGGARKYDRLFNDFHQSSKGNVGVALGRWISSIHKDSNNVLTIEKPAPVKFPEVRDPEWKLVLYHLVLHGKLTEKQLAVVFGGEEWVRRVLHELVKSSLVDQVSTTEYVLHPGAKPYVEAWLKDLKILN